MTADLARRLRAGDISAFEELFRELHAPLCEVVDSYIRSQSIAEELVQDLFFTVWMRRAELDVKSIRGYLFTAARNRSLHHLRRQSLSKRWAQMVQRFPDLVAPPARADEELVADEEHAALRLAIDALPPRTRLALVLSTDHEMSHAEIAAAMGITLKGVEKLLASARQKLRARLVVLSEAKDLHLR